MAAKQIDVQAKPVAKLLRLHPSLAAFPKTNMEEAVRWWSLLQLCIFALLEGVSVGVAVTEVRLSDASRPYVLAGEAATLLCQYVVEPNEEVTEVQWEKDDELVYLWTLGEGRGEAMGVLRGRVDLDSSSPSSLTLSKAHMDLQGTYTCRVRTNGKTAHNDMVLVVIVDACKESAWKTHTDMSACTEDLTMSCVGIFPKPSPACGVYSEKTGKYLSSVPFDSVNVLHNGTYSVAFNRRFSVRDWLGHTDISFRCYIVVLGTPWRSGITHKMFGAPGCERSPPSIRRGYYNVSGGHSCWGFPSEGATAEYQCEPGHQLRGSALYVCSQGRWVPEGVAADQLPTCGDGRGSSLSTCPWTLLLLLFALHILTSRRE